MYRQLVCYSWSSDKISSSIRMKQTRRREWAREVIVSKFTENTHTPGPHHEMSATMPERSLCRNQGPLPLLESFELHLSDHCTEDYLDLPHLAAGGESSTTKMDWWWKPSQIQLQFLRASDLTFSTESHSLPSPLVFFSKSSQPTRVVRLWGTPSISHRNKSTHPMIELRQWLLALIPWAKVTGERYLKVWMSLSLDTNHWILPLE